MKIKDRKRKIKKKTKSVADEALIAEANRFQGMDPRVYSMGGGCSSFSCPFSVAEPQDERLLDLMGNEEKDPLGKGLVGRAEEMEVKKALEAHKGLEGEELSFAIIPNKFSEFSSSLGLLVVGFEKEITVLLRKMESKKGSGIKVSRGSRKSLSSHLEREIRKLEMFGELQLLSSLSQGEKGSNGDSILSLWCRGLLPQFAWWLALLEGLRVACHPS